MLSLTAYVFSLSFVLKFENCVLANCTDENFSVLARGLKANRKENLPETTSVKRSLSTEDPDMKTKVAKCLKEGLEPLKVKKQVSLCSVTRSVSLLVTTVGFLA